MFSSSTARRRRVLLLAFICLPWAAPGPAAGSAESVLTEIDSLRTSDQLGAALDLAGSHVARARAAGDSAFLMRLLMRQGSILAGIGRAKQAEPALREALALAEAMDDSLTICFALRWLSVAVSIQGRGEEAEALCTRLLDAARRSSFLEYDGWAQIGLGWQALQRGEFARAIDFYRRALPPLEKAGVVNGVPWAWNGMATAQLRRGRYDQALASYRRASAAAALMEVSSMRRYVLNTIINNLATLEYQFGDPSLAAEDFRRAYRMHLQSGNIRAAIIPGLNVALCLTMIGRDADAADELLSLAARCRRSNYVDLYGRVLNSLADVRHAQGRLSEAGALYRRSLALSDTLPVPARVAACLGLARVLNERDSTRAALDALEVGRRILTAKPDAELELLLKTDLGCLRHQQGRPRQALALLLEVSAEERSRGLSRHSFRALTTAASCCKLLGRPDSALVLLEAAADIWDTDRGVPLDPLWREQRSAWSHQIYTELALLLLGDAGDDRQGGRTEIAFDRMQIFKARTLMERVHGPGPAGARDRQMRDFATLRVLQQEVLRPGELLLDAYLGPRASLIFAVARNACRVVYLPGEDILNTKLRLYRRILEAPPPDSLLGRPLQETVRASLRELLLGELGDLLSACDRLIVVPDGALNLLPLAELRRAPGNAQCRPGTTLRVPSATYLMWVRRQPRAAPPPRGGRLLAIGADLGPRGAALPGAVEEVHHLAERYRNVDMVVIAGGTPAGDLRQRLADYDLLHFAAHARVDDRNPWRSAIDFRPGDERAAFYADQIAALRLPARLAVLSSCESAAGRVLSGEGVLGLSGAFLSAGVPAVMASLWEVDDRITARFMEHFYAALADGQMADMALAAAQEALRRDPATSHPCFWAGFILTGKGDTLVSLIPRTGFLGAPPRLLGLLLAVVATLIAGWRLHLRFRRRPQAPAG